MNVDSGNSVITDGQRGLVTNLSVAGKNSLKADLPSFACEDVLLGATEHTESGFVMLAFSIVAHVDNDVVVDDGTLSHVASRGGNADGTVSDGKHDGLLYFDGITKGSLRWRGLGSGRPLC